MTWYQSTLEKRLSSTNSLKLVRVGHHQETASVFPLIINMGTCEIYQDLLCLCVNVFSSYNMLKDAISGVEVQIHNINVRVRLVVFMC